MGIYIPRQSAIPTNQTPPLFFPHRDDGKQLSAHHWQQVRVVGSRVGNRETPEPTENKPYPWPEREILVCKRRTASWGEFGLTSQTGLPGVGPGPAFYRLTSLGSLNFIFICMKRGWKRSCCRVVGEESDFSSLGGCRGWGSTPSLTQWVKRIWPYCSCGSDSIPGPGLGPSIRRRCCHKLERKKGGCQWYLSLEGVDLKAAPSLLAHFVPL